MKAKESGADAGHFAGADGSPSDIARTSLREGAARAAAHPAAVKSSGAYKYYVLLVLALVGVVNAADRQIVAILAEAIKADFGVSDAQLAFLFGTAFITLYILLGLAVARLADRMRRTRLLAGGLTLWSGLTTLGGFAPNFHMLAAARFGVGIGEATANPVSHSLICDYFPPRQRSMALSSNLAGLFIGGGLATMAGGQILENWPGACGALGACAIRPWQAALLIVGAPGLLLALMVAFLREPVRGAIEGRPIVPPPTGHWRSFFGDLGAVVPGISTFVLRRDCGMAVAGRSLAWTFVIFAAGAGLAAVTGDWGQWMALAVVVSAVVAWVLRTDVIDPPLIRLTFRTPVFWFGLAGYALIATLTGAVLFWMVPYAIRTFAVGPGVAGVTLGLTITLCSAVGVVAGGWVSDRWRERDSRGYCFSSIGALVLTVLALIAMISVTSYPAYVVAMGIFQATAVAWSGSAAAYIQDLVLPRMRATAAALFALLITMVHMAGGPYFAGRIGEALDSLALGMLSQIALAPFAIFFMLLAARHYQAAVDSKAARAGEASGRSTSAVDRRAALLRTNRPR